MKASIPVLVAVLAAAVIASARGASDGKIVFHASIAGAPAHVSIADGSVWVAEHRGGFLYRINPRTNTKRAIPVDDVMCSPATFGAGKVWVGGCSDNPVTFQIDPKTNRVVRQSPYTNPVYGAGSLWAYDNRGGVLRLDPRTGVRLADIYPGVDITSTGAPLGVWAGTLWVAADTAVSRIDVQTNKVTQVIPLPGGKASGDVAGGYLYGGYGTFAAGKLWLSDAAGIYMVDPAAGTARRLPIHLSALSDFGDIYVVAGAGSVWARINNTTVVRLDPTNGHLLQRYATDGNGGGGGIAVGYGSLWVANFGSDSITRIPIH